MKYKLAKGWTNGRWHQLHALRELLIEVRHLNSGNNHLQRTARCIKTATKLLDPSPNRKRCSFMRFLDDLAVGEADPE